MMTKSGGSSSSVWERRRARKSSRARGKGAGCSGGGARPFIGTGSTREAKTGGNGWSKWP
jgi:hypothetical protein